MLGSVASCPCNLCQYFDSKNINLADSVGLLVGNMLFFDTDSYVMLEWKLLKCNLC